MKGLKGFRVLGLQGLRDLGGLARATKPEHDNPKNPNPKTHQTLKLKTPSGLPAPPQVPFNRALMALNSGYLGYDRG